ncbi:RHS repeat protein [Aliikangiella marina]|uniref:RHS repeat protein n=1 Tax=Aliikangiella marina TaxID=1712262 RepID=A0A545TGV5_9GAMM|nr:RHS repeat protein [Aliikangiella marina]TQV76453.1 RHS repeat protein [Aliikangiella marina]
MRTFKSYLLGILGISGLVLSKSAVSGIDQELTLPSTAWQVEVKGEFTVLDDSLGGESIDFSNGGLSFRHVDVSIPGNSGPAIEFARNYRIDGIDYSGNVLGGWTPDIPFITYRLDRDVSSSIDNGTSTPDTCFMEVLPRLAGAADGVGHKKIWGNIRMSIPGAGMKVLVKPATNSVNHPYDDDVTTWLSKTGTTSDNWKIYCGGAIKNVTGTGIIAVSPEGRQFHFDQFTKRYAGWESHFESNTRGGGDDSDALHFNHTFHHLLYATKVVEPNGSYVEYNFDNFGYLASITASDGRRIDINYNAPLFESIPASTYDLVAVPYEAATKTIKEVKANGRTWKYEYAASTDANYHTGYQRNLRSVVLPDNRKWTFNLPLQNNRATEYYNSSRCWEPDKYQGQTHYGSWVKRFPSTIYVEHPHGVRVDYELEMIKDAGGRKNTSNAPETEVDENLNDPTKSCESKFSNFTSSLAVISKKVRNTDGSQYEWSASYDESNQCRAPSISTIPTKLRTVIDPEGIERRQYYYCGSDQYGHDEHGKLAREDIYEGTTLLERTDYSYVSESFTKPFGYGFPNSGFEQTNTVLSQKIIKRGSDVYTTSLAYDLDPSKTEYDFGLPKQVTTSSTLQSGNRTAIYDYRFDKTNWILGDILSINKNGKLFDQVVYDDIGRPTEHRRFGVRVASYKYSTVNGTQLGTLTEYTDALGNKTKFSNYHRGAARTVIRPDNKTVIRTVDDNGWVTSVTNARGDLFSYQYNNVGWLTNIDRPTPWNDTLITYSGLGNGLMQSTTRGDLRTTKIFDGFLRPVLVKNEAVSGVGISSYIATQFDNNGRVSFSSFPSTNSNPSDGVNNTYDGLGRLTQVKENVAPNATSTFTFLSNNRIRETNANGHITTMTKSGYGHPDDGHVTLIQSPENTNTAMTYDIYGNMLSVRQYGTHNGVTTDQTQLYSYDARNRLCRHYVPEVNSTLYAYNNADQMIGYAAGQSGTSGCASLPAAAKIEMTYDSMGNNTAVNFPDSTTNITKTYDVSGNLATINRGGANWSYQYNALDLITQESLSIDGRSFSVDYEYDSLGHLKSILYPSGKTTSVTVNALGQMTKVGNYVTDANYFANGSLKDFTFGNGATYSATQNSRLLPTAMKLHNGAGTQLAAQRFEWDSNRNIDRILDDVDSQYNINMTYDGLDRLVNANGFWGTGTISYDSLGNIRSKIMGSQSLTYNYDSLNRLSNVSGGVTRSFSYDSRGNVINNGVRSFTYNLGNIMTDSGTLNYVYDGHDRRVSKTKDGKTEYSFYSQSGTLMYRQKSNGDHSDYIRLGDRLITILESR